MNKAMISTWKMSYDGMLKAKDILQQDGSVQAAILAAIQDVEAREEFISVGHGGLPNAQGHVPVSYTHLDVYKRQEKRMPSVVSKLTIASGQWTIGASTKTMLCLPKRKESPSFTVMVLSSTSKPN